MHQINAERERFRSQIARLDELTQKQNRLNSELELEFNKRDSYPSTRSKEALNTADEISRLEEEIEKIGEQIITAQRNSAATNSFIMVLQTSQQDIKTNNEAKPTNTFVPSSIPSIPVADGNFSTISSRIPSELPFFRGNLPNSKHE